MKDIMFLYNIDYYIKKRKTNEYIRRGNDF